MIPFSGHRTIERDRTVESEKSLAALEADGGFDVIAFGTGFRATSNLRIGATLNHWMNGFHQELTRSRSTGRLTQIVADFDFSGWNVNMGFIWSPRENLNIGGVAKTPFSGRVRLWKEKTDYFPGSGDGASTTSQNALRRDDLRIDFPAAFGLGASWRLRSSLTLAADYTRTEWSNAQIHNFFVLRTPEPDPAVFEDLSPTRSSTRTRTTRSRSVSGPSTSSSTRGSSGRCVSATSSTGSTSSRPRGRRRSSGG